MKIGKSVVFMLALAAVVALNSGCASYMVYKDSSEQVAMRKAVATNNEPAMRGIKNGDNPSEHGIAVPFTEAIAERPVLQTVAAIADIGIGYLGYEGIKSVSDDDGDSKDGSPSADRNISGENTTIVQGNGNTVNVSGSGGGFSDGSNLPLTITP